MDKNKAIEKIKKCLALGKSANEHEAAQALKVSVQRLLDAMEAFAEFNGTLRPHFAYGELTKPQYERAHLMHLAQHWTQFHAATAQSLVLLNVGKDTALAAAIVMHPVYFAPAIIFGLYYFLHGDYTHDTFC